MKFLYKNRADIILKLIYDVYDELGYGFLKKGYQNSCLIELRNKELNVIPHKKIEVFYI